MTGVKGGGEGVVPISDFIGLAGINLLGVTSSSETQGQIDKTGEIGAS